MPKGSTSESMFVVLFASDCICKYKRRKLTIYVDSFVDSFRTMDSKNNSQYLEALSPDLSLSLVPCVVTPGSHRRREDTPEDDDVCTTDVSDNTGCMH